MNLKAGLRVGPKSTKFVRGKPTSENGVGVLGLAVVDAVTGGLVGPTVPWWWICGAGVGGSCSKWVVGIGISPWVGGTAGNTVVVAWTAGGGGGLVG